MPETYSYKQEDPSSSTSVFDGTQGVLTYTSSSFRNTQDSKADKRSRGTRDIVANKNLIFRQIACAECRRLKIKCDRLVPCSTCVKRGCQSLCPNGTIPPGQGSRFVLAATEHLQGKLARLEARMHALEDALAIAQAEESNESHPLLASDEHKVKEEPVMQTVPEDADGEEPSALADALGTLYIDRGGFSRFFGPSGSSETILQLHSREPDPVTNSPRHLPELDRSYLPPEILHFSQCFPMTPSNIPVASIKSSIESLLPPIERAISLCDTFLEHLSWMFHIVSRKQIVDELIPIVYKQKDSPYGPHDLALVLIVCGIGALVDLNLEPYNLEAQHYYQLSRAAVVLQSVMVQPAMVTIKVRYRCTILLVLNEVLHLMSIYNGMSGQESNLEQSYALLNLADQVALRIGFHIDPTMWKFDGREVYDRRVYFWNLLSATLWQSLVTGRPPAILSNYIDTKIPTPEEEYTYQLGEVPLGFGIWGFRASDECLLHVVRATLSAKPPPYETIMDLDSKIRNFTTVPKAGSSGPVDERTALSMRTFVRSHYQALMLMYLHRAYFTQAMTEYPSNPLLSPYRKSVIAAYESACSVLDDTRVQFAKKPDLCARVWRIWSFAFTAAVIVGTVAARGFHLNLEPPALEAFNAACNVFKDAAEISNRAAKALPVMQAMLKKAIEAQRNAQHNQLVLDSELKAEDELTIMSGKPTFIQGDQPRRPPNSSSVSPSPESAQQQNQSTYSSVPLSTQNQTYPNNVLNTQNQRSDSNYPSVLNVPMDSYQHSLDKPAPTSDRRMSLSTLTSPISSYPMAPSSGGATFADLSQGWGGLFHETAGSMSMGMYNYSNPSHTPSHPPGHSRAYSHSRGQLNPTPNVSVDPSRGWDNSTSGMGMPENQRHEAAAYSGGATLNDKWSSFMMNYNVLDSVPAQVGMGNAAHGRYSHPEVHHGHTGYQ
ncbi:hypothetical protein VKT23_009029 [Stygiomarasmius scandens]|uniref:Zn(2)-C6 fungal-type domain-containing protein n=1 Tax=Marasmiellus scandens TaxID=2682957 RepID=A0ABR1JIK5_9AGAR